MKPLPPQPDPEQQLTAYLLGELSPEQSRELEAQLAQDSSLRSELDSLRKTVSLLKHAGPIECGDEKPSPDALAFSAERRADLLKTLSSEAPESQPATKPSKTIPWYFHLGAAAGVAALLMISLAFQFLSSKSPAARALALGRIGGVQEAAENDSLFSGSEDLETLTEIEELIEAPQLTSPASAPVDRYMYFQTEDDTLDTAPPTTRRLLESAPETMPAEKALARTGSATQRSLALGDASRTPSSFGRHQAGFEPSPANETQANRQIVAKNENELTLAFSAPQTPQTQPVEQRKGETSNFQTLLSTLASKKKSLSDRQGAASEAKDSTDSIDMDTEVDAAVEFSENPFGNSTSRFGDQLTRNDVFSQPQLPAIVSGGRSSEREARGRTTEAILPATNDESSPYSIAGSAGAGYGGGGGYGGGAGGLAGGYGGVRSQRLSERLAGGTVLSDQTSEQAIDVGRTLARSDNGRLGLALPQVDQLSDGIQRFEQEVGLGAQLGSIEGINKTLDLLPEQQSPTVGFALSERSRGSSAVREQSSQPIEVDPLTGLPAPSSLSRSFSSNSLQVDPQSGLVVPSTTPAPAARFGLVPQVKQPQSSSSSSAQWDFTEPSDSNVTALDRKMPAPDAEPELLAKGLSISQNLYADIDPIPHQSDAFSLGFPDRSESVSESLVAESTRGITVQSRPEPLARESESLNRRPWGSETQGLVAAIEPLAQETALDDLASQPLVREELEKDLAQQTSKTAEAAKETLPVFPMEVETASQPTSTFSLNVSEVSFRLAAAALNQGQLPDPTTIRPEEFFNALPYRDLPQQSEEPVVMQTERVAYPFGHQQELLRVSVRTTATGRSPNRPLNLVVLLDNSGSMERPDRQLIVRKSLETLLGTLRSHDVVSLITFARSPRLRIDGQRPETAIRSLDAVLQLVPEGGTNLEQAISTAYEVARKHFQPQGENRIILLTDGAANLGNTNHDSLRQLVTEQRDQGIALDGFGIGWVGFDDQRLEALTRNGDGRYAFLNDLSQVESDFQRHLTGALNVAAKNVKVQVTFNPERVLRYRQIGYAKHQLKAEDFRNNKVDAAELSATEAGTALYVITPNPDGRGPIGELAVRFQDPESGTFEERHWPLNFTSHGAPFDQASTETQLATVAALFAERLAGIPYSAEITWQDLITIADRAASQRQLELTVADLKEMILQAQSISGF